LKNTPFPLQPAVKTMLCKVPEVTFYFWIIKVLCTTVGETAADYINGKMGLGLTWTTIIMGGLLAIVLVLQFKLRKYVPAVYWLAVVLLSVFGTLITDNLSDNFKVSLVTSTVLFSIALAVTFAAWQFREKTLAIHSIYTTRREAFYWLAILFTFALGTAAGDLVAEKFGLGYLVSIGIFAGLIALVGAARSWVKLNGIFAFWVAYILTRPLGATIGDYLSQPKKDGGLGLGTVITSAIFLVAILSLVVFLARTKQDAVAEQATETK
jgi:uncharacterized membrane-anchored protein